jgi:hypothetical protein
MFDSSDKDALPPPQENNSETDNDNDNDNDKGSIPPISDIPLPVVNELLYGKAALLRMRRVQSQPALLSTSGTNKTNSFQQQ